MTGRPDIVMHEDALRVFLSCRKAERDRLVQTIETIANNADQSGEFTQRGADGRTWKAVRSGRHLVFFWLDGPVNELRIMKIEPLFAPQ